MLKHKAINETKLNRILIELDVERITVYKATQRIEYKRLCKIYNQLLKYNVLMINSDNNASKELIEELAIEYYKLIRPELEEEYFNV